MERNKSVKAFLINYLKEDLDVSEVPERQISQALQQYIEENTEEVLEELATALENRCIEKTKSIFEETNFYDYFLQEDTGSTELYYKIKEFTEQESRGNCKWE